MKPQAKKPTILVKQPDGTYVRKSLEEIKSAKNKSEPPKNSNVKIPQPPMQASAPVKKEVATPIVKKNSVVPKKNITPPPPLPVRSETKSAVPTSFPKATKDDFIFSDDHEISTSKNQPLISASRSSEAEEIMHELSFKVDPTLEKKLQTIIQLYLKDIRSEEDTKAACLKKREDNGLGLTSAQAEEVLTKTKSKQQLIVEPNLLPLSLNTLKQPQSRIQPPKKNTPSLSASPTVAQTPPTPLKSSITEPVKSAQSSSNQIDFANFKKNRPLMRDVEDKPLSLGPIDEIRAVTLTDFRRLANTPIEAAMRLGQKFLNLKLESILLLVDALAAWKTSPLFMEYTSAVLEACGQRKKLEQVLGDKQKIQLAEIYALLDMEKKVSI
jgi:hypothetical protein